MSPTAPSDDRSPGRGSAAILVAAMRDQGVSDERVLAAFGRVPRELFVPPAWSTAASRDRPIPIAHGQVTTQPSLIGRMVAALRLQGTERVLEVGTGLGFQTAILAVLAREVFSVERFADLAEAARSNLAAVGIRDVTVVVGDGTRGLPGEAPFDAIVVAAAAPVIPDPLAEQLTEGGRIVHPVGPGGDELVTVFRKGGGELVRERLVVPAHFVPLIGEHGVPDRPL